MRACCHRRRDRWRAKYELLHTARTLLPSDAAFQAIQWCQDGAGVRGLRFRARAIVAAAADVLRANLTTLAPLVLPLPELVRPSLPTSGIPVPTRLCASFVGETDVDHSMILGLQSWC